MASIPDHTQGILDTLPSKPGCYLMKDQNGKVIYVGKAVNLRSRIRSYFQSGGDQSRKTHKLVQQIHDIDWIVVDSELEALILEMNLIKRHRPYFNVRLKDDKRYPYIKAHWYDPFPKITVTRKMINDGSKYYGPYTSVWAVHQTLDLLRKIFPFRTCDRVITGQDSRACLYYDIKLCTAPCIGKIDQAHYQQMINDLGKFLEGKTDPIIKRLQNEMQLLSKDLQYEQAALIRDQILAIERVVEKQKVISSRQMNSDVVALARNNGEACVQIFFIRSGKLIGREYFILEGTDEEKDSEVIAQFLKQFYANAAFIPSEVLLPNEVEESIIIQQWLNQGRGGKKIQLKVPRRGTSKQLVKMATENAIETLRALKEQWEADTHKQSAALAQLQKVIGLAQPPNRIECYDISNIQGTAAVGSMVVFEQGTPNKKLYRRFNIKSVHGPDDYASMEEVLVRRFRRWQASQEQQEVGKKADLSFSVLPDLLIVDGGLGQLNRAIGVLNQFNLKDKVQAAALAKEEELLFIPGNAKPIALPKKSQGLYLLQRIRDEAHRFAITAHRIRRQKHAFLSPLDQIPGIGPARKRALLLKFGSIQNIGKASPESIMQLPGITEALAKQILDHLNDSS